MKKISGLLIILLSILAVVNIAFAIPNPSSTYCIEMGYTLDGENCIFDDSNYCEQWAFYRGECGQEYVKELPCAKAGERRGAAIECCEGLETMDTSMPIRDGLCAMRSGYGICSDCGNGICEDWENKCNCEADCSYDTSCISDNDCILKDKGLLDFRCCDSCDEVEIDHSLDKYIALNKNWFSAEKIEYRKENCGEIACILCAGPAKIINDNYEVKCIENQCTKLEKTIGCPEDARVCPDGSTVVRVSPDCEFEKCPKECDDIMDPNECLDREDCENIWGSPKYCKGDTCPTDIMWNGCRKIGEDSVDCDGCLKDEVCLQLGIRIDNMYCDIDSNFKSQKQEDSACQNNYECLTNQCSSGKCIDLNKKLEEQQNLLEKILDWFARLFGGKK